MWSLARQLLVGSLAVWSVAADISVSIEAVRDDGVDFSSDIKLVPVPPRERWQHGTRHRTRPSSGGSTNNKRNTISYSGNWCGASQHSTAKDPIVSAFSYFTAPNLSLRKGIPPPQYAAAWVGVDGAECKQALLQAGATTVVNSNGGQSAWAWWQWYPAASYKIGNLPVKPGDWMSVSVTVLSPTSGKLVITNAQQGYEVAITVTGGPKLCQLDAEWLVEDFYDPDDGQVNFARFSDLWFLEAQAKTASGKTIGIDNAAMVYLQNENGTVVCKAEKWDNANFVATSP